MPEADTPTTTAEEQAFMRNERKHAERHKHTMEHVHHRTEHVKHAEDAILKQLAEEEDKAEAAKKEELERIKSELAEKEHLAIMEHGVKRRFQRTYSGPIKINLNDPQHQEQLHPKELPAPNEEAMKIRTVELMKDLGQVNLGLLQGHPNATKIEALVKRAQEFNDQVSNHSELFLGLQISNVLASTLTSYYLGDLVGQIHRWLGTAGVMYAVGAPPGRPEAFSPEDAQLAQLALQHPGVRESIPPQTTRIANTLGGAASAAVQSIQGVVAPIVHDVGRLYDQGAQAYAKKQQTPQEKEMYEHGSRQALQPPVRDILAQKAEALPNAKPQLNDMEQGIDRLVKESGGSVPYIKAQLWSKIMETSRNAREFQKQLQGIHPEIQDVGIEKAEAKHRQVFKETLKNVLKRDTGFDLDLGGDEKDAESFLQLVGNLRFGDAAVRFKNWLVNNSDTYFKDKAQRDRIKQLPPEVFAKVVAHVADEGMRRIGLPFTNADTLFMDKVKIDQMLNTVAQEAVKDPRKAAALLMHMRQSFGIMPDDQAKLHVRPRSFEPNLYSASGTGAEQLMLRPAPPPSEQSVPGDRRKKKKRKPIEPAALQSFKKIKSDRVNYLEKVIAGHAPLLQQRAGFP